MKPTPRDPLARRSQAGATFVELMLAVLIISTTVVASSSSMRSSAEVYHYFSNGKHEALMLAQELHEAAKLLPWDDTGVEAPNFGTDVYDLWDFDGKQYSPPRSAEYDLVISHIGWSQEVDVRVVDMDHPDVEVDPATFAGETLVEFRVTVRNGPLVVDEVGWWLSEATQGQ